MCEVASFMAFINLIWLSVKKKVGVPGRVSPPLSEKDKLYLHTYEQKVNQFAPLMDNISKSLDK